MEWNGEVCPERFRDMGLAFGLPMEGTTEEEAISMVVNAIRNLALRLDIPQHIKDVGGKEEDIEILAEKALNDPCTGGNPREVTKEDFIKLFKKCF